MPPQNKTKTKTKKTKDKCALHILAQRGCDMILLDCLKKMEKDDENVNIQQKVCGMFSKHPYNNNILILVYRFENIQTWGFETHHIMFFLFFFFLQHFF